MIRLKMAFSVVFRKRQKRHFRNHQLLVTNSRMGCNKARRDVKLTMISVVFKLILKFSKQTVAAFDVSQRTLRSNLRKDYLTNGLQVDQEFF